MPRAAGQWFPLVQADRARRCFPRTTRPKERGRGQRRVNRRRRLKLMVVRMLLSHAPIADRISSRYSDFDETVVEARRHSLKRR